MPRQRKLPSGMQKRGSMYYAAFRTNGRLVRRKLAGDFRTAESLLIELKARTARGDFGMLDNDYPLEEIKQQWLRYCEQTLRPRTVQRYRQNLANIEAGLPARTAQQVTVKAIVAYRTARLAEGVSARTVNMDVVALSTMLTWAAEKAKIIGSNPLAGVDPLPNEARSKERRPLTVEEVEAIFVHSPDCLKPVWRMFAVTGIRHEELVDLRFTDIDFERRTITIRAQTAKNGTKREIPLNDDMLVILRELKREAAFREPDGSGPKHVARGKLARFSREHVFVTSSNTPWDHHLLDRFYAVCKAAEIENAKPGGSVDIHALRGTFITLAIDGGANPKAVQRIVGHKSSRMTMDVYAKATEQGKRAAVSALPFVKASAPKHAISAQSVRTECASTESATEVQAASALA